ncbi:RIP metalloprotease RseP [Myroides sp. LJL116]
MDILIKLSQFILSLSLLIILHELGHFIPAKIFKTRVEKFYLFFDIKFSLFKKKIGDTVYGIGWLPLGGYVKIAGMVDESMDTDQLAGEPQPWEFRSKPAWQRLIIMLGGVTVNFILAFVIYIGMVYAYGDLYIDNKDIEHGVVIQSPVLLEAGLQTGDNIISVDGKQIDRFHNINEALLLGHNVIVQRDGVQKEIQLPVDLIDQVMQNKGGGFVSLRLPFIVGAIEPGSINEGVFQEKDVITQINGQTVEFYDQVGPILEQYKASKVPVIVQREGNSVEVMANIDSEGKLNLYYMPGLTLDNLEKLGLYTISKEKYSLLASIPIGIEKGKERILSYFSQLKKIVQPETGAYKGLGGFKTMYDIFPQYWSWEVFWNITAMFSIMLGVMNLLPIPALDGGHVMFLLYEMITGRKPSDKFLENAQMVGFFILIGLLVYANGNDIYRAIFSN